MHLIDKLIGAVGDLIPTGAAGAKSHSQSQCDTTASGPFVHRCISMTQKNYFLLHFAQRIANEAADVGGYEWEIDLWQSGEVPQSLNEPSSDADMRTDAT